MSGSTTPPAISRQAAIQAVALLGFDAATATELVVTPNRITATYLEPERPDGRERQLITESRKIAAPRLPRATLATGVDERAAASDGF